VSRPKSCRKREKEKLHDDEKWMSVSRSRVAREMQAMSLRCKTKKRFVVTTDSKHSMPVAPNLLNRDFEQEYPNRPWVSDITYLPVKNRWMYLVVFIDLFNRKVVGWDLSDSLEAESSITALNRAYWKRKPAKGLIVHSDRGVQYASKEFRKALKMLRCKHYEPQRKLLG
jgi:putative transposase